MRINLPCWKVESSYISKFAGSYQQTYLRLYGIFTIQQEVKKLRKHAFLCEVVSWHSVDASQLLSIRYSLENADSGRTPHASRNTTRVWGLRGGPHAMSQGACAESEVLTKSTLTHRTLASIARKHDA